MISYIKLPTLQRLPECSLPSTIVPMPPTPPPATYTPCKLPADDQFSILLPLGIYVYPSVTLGQTYERDHSMSVTFTQHGIL